MDKIALSCYHAAMKAPSHCKHKPSLSNCQDCGFGLICLPLNEAEGSEILSRRERQLAKQLTLCRAQQAFSTLYLVKSGLLKAFSVESSGKERILGFYFPGEVIGLEAIADGIYPFTIQSLTDTSLCEITFESLQAKINHHTDRQLKLLQLTSQRLNTGVCLRYARAEQRIVSFLQEIAQRLHCCPEQGFFLPLSRHTMAAYLGLAPETVIRLMARLQQQGYLSLDKKYVQFVDRAKIDRLLQGQALEGFS